MPLRCWMVAAAVLVSLSACNKQVIVVDGFDVYERVWNRTTEELARRARFDTGCDGPFDYTLFAKGGPQPTEVGVSGCGKRLRYHYLRGDWILDVVAEAETRTYGDPERLGRAPAAPGSSGDVRRGSLPDGRRGVRLRLVGSGVVLEFTGVPASSVDTVEFEAKSRNQVALPECESYAIRRGHDDARPLAPGSIAFTELRALGEGPARIELCGRHLTLSPAHAELIGQFISAFEAVARDPVGEPTEPAEPAQPVGDPQAAVRAAIDAKREAVLACSGGRPIAVHVSWDDAGSTTFSLTSDDEAVLGCVRHALREVAVPEGSPKGAILHPVS